MNKITFRCTYLKATVNLSVSYILFMFFYFISSIGVYLSAVHFLELHVGLKFIASHQEYS